MFMEQKDQLVYESVVFLKKKKEEDASLYRVLEITVKSLNFILRS